MTVSQLQDLHLLTAGYFLLLIMVGGIMIRANVRRDGLRVAVESIMVVGWVLSWVVFFMIVYIQ